MGRIATATVVPGQSSNGAVAVGSNPNLIVDSACLDSLAEQAWPRVSPLGNLMRFWSEIVAVYPDSLVQDLIAHELAHVWQAACGWDLLTASAYEAEEDADFVMESWGFHATAMDEWDCQNGISKAKAITIDLDTPKGAGLWHESWLASSRKGGKSQKSEPKSD